MYAAFQASRAVGLVALAAGIVLTNGWQAVAIAVAILAGSAFLFTFLVILATGERRAAPHPILAAEAATVHEHGAANAEVRREVTPAPSPEQPRARARMVGPVSSAHP
jgi:hypothetical protein